MIDPKRGMDLNCMHCGRPMTKHPKYCFAGKRTLPMGCALAWFAICGLVALSVVYVAHHFIAKWW